jgi:hypothetical protein
LDLFKFIVERQLQYSNSLEDYYSKLNATLIKWIRLYNRPDHFVHSFTTLLEASEPEQPLVTTGLVDAIAQHSMNNPGDTKDTISAFKKVYKNRPFFSDFEKPIKSRGGETLLCALLDSYGNISTYRDLLELGKQRRAPAPQQRCAVVSHFFF